MILKPGYQGVRINRLENEIDKLEAIIMDLKAMEIQMVPLDSWQAVSAVTLIIGLAIGATLIYTRK